MHVSTYLLFLQTEIHPTEINQLVSHGFSSRYSHLSICATHTAHIHLSCEK